MIKAQYMNLTVRNAKPRDVDFILYGIKDTFRIEKDVFNDKICLEKKRLAKKAIKNNQVRIALKENNPVGFLWFKISDVTPFGLDYGRWSKKYCWISYVYILKGYRNQGIGSLLYDDITKICKKRGVKHIMLDVFTVNEKSARFHRKKGFKPFLSIYSKNLI